MKAITLWEPWASLMAIGAKVNETRGVRTSHRGDICIHAAKADRGVPDSIYHRVLDLLTDPKNRPIPTAKDMGCILAVVELWDVQPSHKFLINPKNNSGFFNLTEDEYAFGNYSIGCWIYRTRNLRRLKNPVPCRGAQSIGWTVPPDVEAKVRAQL